MDEQLKAQWGADVPASDPRFVLAVMTRIERRRFMREVAMTAGLSVCAMVLLWLMAPTVVAVWHDGIAPHASNAAILLSLMGITIALPQFFPARS
ncbi:MAG TPA: hypothetical protein VHC39_01835 [Rhizomicrobium sp.]|nr:hypothetical protein [Rhizomicrobium sp.]